MRKRLAALFALILLTVMSGVVHAQLLGVTCLASTTNTAFGIYDPSDGFPTDSSSGSVTVSCTGGLLSPGIEPVTITLSAGQSGNFAPRRMNGPASGGLSYNLYTAANHTIVWGNGTGGSSSVAGQVNITACLKLLGVCVTPGSGSTTLTIYGRIPAGQTVTAGAYVDSINVTVTY